MMNNNYHLAKSLTIANQHTRIDSWAETHGAFACRAIWLFTNDNWLEGVVGGGGMGCNDIYCNGSDSIICYIMDYRVYYFYIDDIEITKNELGWQITNWGEICEERIGKSRICW